MLVEKVPDKKPIGMLYLDCIKLKQVLMPSPLKCLDVSVSNTVEFCTTGEKIRTVDSVICFILY